MIGGLINLFVGNLKYFLAECIRQTRYSRFEQKLPQRWAKLESGPHCVLPVVRHQAQEREPAAQWHGAPRVDSVYLRDGTPGQP